MILNLCNHSLFFFFLLFVLLFFLFPPSSVFLSDCHCHPASKKGWWLLFRNIKGVERKVGGKEMGASFFVGS